MLLTELHMLGPDVVVRVPRDHGPHVFAPPHGSAISVLL